MLKNLSTQEKPLKNMVGTAKVQEKLLLQGRRALSEIELIALILNSSAKCKLSMVTATKILNYCENNLQELARLSIEELSLIEGISVSQAMSLSAAFELANRKNNISIRKYKIKQSKDAFELFFSQFEDLDHEHFYVAFLNRANYVTRCELLSVGGLSGTVVDVRMILNRAILLKSSAIILAHNHPSGNLNPSEQDRDITRKVKEACNLFDILLMDHLILSNHSYLSFADEGYLK